MNSECTFQVDTDCVACQTCNDGLSFETVSCSVSADRQCFPCAPACDATSFETRACTALFDRQCTPITGLFAEPEFTSFRGEIIEFQSGVTVLGECASTCALNVNCVAFTYSETTDRCIILASYEFPPLFEIVPDQLYYQRNPAPVDLFQENNLVDGMLSTRDLTGLTVASFPKGIIIDFQMTGMKLRVGGGGVNIVTPFYHFSLSFVLSVFIYFCVACVVYSYISVFGTLVHAVCHYSTAVCICLSIRVLSRVGGVVMMVREHKRECMCVCVCVCKEAFIETAILMEKSLPVYKMMRPDDILSRS